MFSCIGAIHNIQCCAITRLHEDETPKVDCENAPTHFTFSLKLCPSKSIIHCIDRVYYRNVEKYPLKSSHFMEFYIYILSEILIDVTKNE